MLLKNIFMLERGNVGTLKCWNVSHFGILVFFAYSQ
jgi:hypothetical protein